MTRIRPQSMLPAAYKSPASGSLSSVALPYDDGAAKWLAVQLFVCGVATLEQTADAFARHPRWRHA